ncbi:hypothetical protein [Chryseolinea lacunae]|uniref:CobQ/CobB/MinD/ParA nucleotide binding domain-containing protein n=1 Tax=Chryseolinea lacunae TaxID=2801331 RepID=A0ABS1KRI8_9BACT|nr:hypothetical protein [Chryseolinea lacunae]MBL0742098.1 hypothetical protein [Chryseolinea lacunae]
MKKNIHFITQAKGGSGKSVLTFMLAEKYKDAVILDLDDATTTSMKQLAYRDPIRVSFLDPCTKRIDRGAFGGLFESLIEDDDVLYVADLGASVAEQLPKYFSMNGIEIIQQTLSENGIELQIICVIGGGNIFKATMEYLHELHDATKGVIKVIVAHNGFYPLSEKQQEDLNDFLGEKNLPLIHFDLVKDKGEIAMRTIENVLRAGKGISGLSPFTALYFRKPIEDLNL